MLQEGHFAEFAQEYFFVRTYLAGAGPVRRQVADDGVGIPADVLAKITTGESSAAGGVGLRNISQRLETLFGERYTLNVQSTVASGTVVDLRIPLR